MLFSQLLDFSVLSFSFSLSEAENFQIFYFSNSLFQFPSYGKYFDIFSHKYYLQFLSLVLFWQSNIRIVIQLDSKSKRIGILNGIAKLYFQFHAVGPKRS
jgi:hypothetical protein